MMKKTMIFFVALIVGVAYADAFAVPSVRQLGTNVSANTTTNTEKNVAVLPSLPKANPEAARVAKTTQVAVKEPDDSRISVAGAIKTINSGRFKQPESYNQVVGMVQKLEGNVENAITGVTESGNGNYVTGIAVGSGNKLEVSKTRVLYAPVFQGNSDTGSNAEIWVVK